MFVFVVSHMTNHAFGLISLQAMDDARPLLTAPWGWTPLRWLLLLTFAFHAGSALWALYARRGLRTMNGGEAAQLILGLLIPFALVTHYVGTRIAFQRHDVLTIYSYVVTYLWVVSPREGLMQAGLLVGVWIHACLGLHGWLRLKPWYRDAAWWLFAGALLLPVVSLLGFVVAGRSVVIDSMDPAWFARTMAEAQAPNPAQVADLEGLRNRLLLLWTGLIAATVAARIGRIAWERRGGLVRVAFPDGRVAQVPRGTTVLEASRAIGFPHAGVCGGRGRCSTCRVRLGRGAEGLAAPSTEEAKVLQRVGAPPNVRLACQIRPTGGIDVAPLLPPTATARDGHARAASHAGQEREVTILFADLRGFTRLAEHKLPYDVVFILNRYFAAMGGAVEGAGGRVDKFIGDGVMALFGIEEDAATGARQALAAAAAMGRALDELNGSLAPDLPEPLRIGIGIHVGPVIVGEMGWGLTRHLTAIGDAVNTASRLEQATKDHGVELVVSEMTLTFAGLGLPDAERREIAVRGRSTALPVVLVRQAVDLARGAT
jgi:adenylate cyclase